MASLLHVYPKETKTRCRHSISSSRVHCSIIRNVKQPRYENNLCPSTDEWTDRTWCDICATDYRSALGKKILPFATTQMDREGIALREISQRQTDKDRKVSPVRGEGEREQLAKAYKHSATRWMRSGNLTYNTGTPVDNSASYSWNFPRVELKSSHRKEKRDDYVKG